MEMLASVLETLMIVSFGISWPINLAKAYRSRSTKGKRVAEYRRNRVSPMACS